MKVLMSSYACEPGKGSEPGVGWNWARVMAARVDLYVVTRKNNRTPIDEYYKENPTEQSAYFIYYDLPQWLLKLKKAKLLPVKLYYLLWQWRVRKLIARSNHKFDIIHHVTFNIFSCPGFWWKTDAKVVLGPLGGGIFVKKEYLPLFKKSSMGQRMRTWILSRWAWLPTVVKSLSRADLIMCANIDTFDLLAGRYKEKMVLHLETGIDIEKVELPQNEDHVEGGKTKFIVVGGIEARKGWQLALNAVKILKDQKYAQSIELAFIGDGPDIENAKQETLRLGIQDYVTWEGKMPHDVTKKEIAGADVLLFPSVRDTSGNVVLEAMSYGKPIVCINHQGVAEMTSDKNAIRVNPSTIEKTSEDIADAMHKLASDPSLRLVMGEMSIERVNDLFTWESKARYLAKEYEEVIFSK